MRGHSEGGARRRRAGVLRWAAGLLVIAGIATLAWCGVLLTDAYIAQQLARQSLDTIVEVARPQISALGRTQTARSPVRRGGAIAVLSIPRVELSAVVLHGSDEQTLRRGPGHLEGTAMPGEAGNAVVAGHRDSFFRPLQQVRLGDDVFVDSTHGRLQYRVTSLTVVQPRDLSVLAPTDGEVLTLITCYPFWLLGNAPERFVVRATRVGSTVAVAAPVAPTTPRFGAVAGQYGPHPAEPTADESAVAQR
jgi:sortase A